ncbi:MAG: MerR family transcriptional regulator [Gemmatimonadota bacterium]
MSPPVIPDKFYFKIGEVSAILGVKPYVVRFWETEFGLAPAKNSSRHRVYRRQEVETLLEIKQLLHTERFTIEGARKQLKERLKERNRQLDLRLPDNRYKAVLRRVKKDLANLREILEK